MKQLPTPAFYCVMVEGQRGSKRPHETYESAETEANRIRAEEANGKANIYILSATHLLPTKTLTLKKKEVKA